MPKPKVLIPALAISSLVCLKSSAMDSRTDVKEEIYGTMPDGQKVKIFTLTNKNGLKAKVTGYGAILVSMEVPNPSGKTADVTLGYDTLAG